MENIDLVPINGNILVKLTESYANVAIPDQKYATKTSGIVISMDSGLKDATDLVGKKVYFESYKDDTNKEIDGQKYSFIKYDEVKGFSNA